MSALEGQSGQAPDIVGGPSLTHTCLRRDSERIEGYLEIIGEKAALCPHLFEWGQFLVPFPCRKAIPGDCQTFLGNTL
jgi:hypothetical protein